MPNGPWFTPRAFGLASMGSLISPTAAAYPSSLEGRDDPARLGRRGLGFAIVGLVASLFAAALTIYIAIQAVDATHTGVNPSSSPMDDPVCASAADDFNSMLAPVTFDNAALSQDCRPPSTVTRVASAR